jgi:hypothetical protein
MERTMEEEDVSSKAKEIKLEVEEMMSIYMGTYIGTFLLLQSRLRH